MKALSIRQPWAWLILHAGKDIENRTWKCFHRGRILIHAGKGMTHDEYDGGRYMLAEIRTDIALPPFEALERGGIVGSVEITGWVNGSNSPWFEGPHGFVLRDPRTLPFTPWKGELGFFHVDQNAFADTMAKPVAGSRDLLA